MNRYLYTLEGIINNVVSDHIEMCPYNEVVGVLNLSFALASFSFGSVTQMGGKYLGPQITESK